MPRSSSAEWGFFYAVRADEPKEGRNRRFPRFNLWGGRFTELLIFGPDSVFRVRGVQHPAAHQRKSLPRASALCAE